MFKNDKFAVSIVQYLQIFCNNLKIFCNICRFSATPADFLQYLQIFCNTCRFSAISTNFLQYLQIFCNTCNCITHASFNSFSISVVVNGALCALKNLPQLHKESTTRKLCHIDAITFKNHLLVLVVEDIPRGVLVESDLEMVTSQITSSNTSGCSKDHSSY